jgi:hypothetical protein
MKESSGKFLGRVLFLVVYYGNALEAESGILEIRPLFLRSVLPQISSTGVFLALGASPK